MGRDQGASRFRTGTGMTRRTALAAVAGLFVAPRLFAQQTGDTRHEAINVIPFNKLTPQATQKITAVIEKPSIYRRVPTQATNCDPEMFTCCLRSPEIVVNIWQLMGITTMTAERTGGYTWKGNDGMGTTGDVELIYGSENLHVVYADGFYEGQLLKRKMTGRTVMILQSAAAEGADARPLVTSRLDMFLQIDNAGIDLVAKSLYPLIGKTCDANFADTVAFIGKISQSAERNGPGMQQLAAKLQNVKAEVRDEFSKTATNVNQRAAARSLGETTPTAVVRSQSPAANTPVPVRSPR